MFNFTFIYVKFRENVSLLNKHIIGIIMNISITIYIRIMYKLFYTFLQYKRFIKQKY